MKLKRQIRHIMLAAALIGLGEPAALLAQPSTDPSAELMSTLIGNDREALIRVLASTPRRLGDYLPTGDTPLGFAIRMSDPAYVSLLLQRGADPNAPDERGLRPLQVAILVGNVDAARALLLAGADRFAQGIDGATPQDWAETFGGARFAQLLPPRPPTPLTVANLHEAIVAGDRAMISRMLAGVADVDATDRLGLTALHIAAGRGDVATIDELLRRRATVDVLAQTGETPLMIAAASNQLAAVRLLLDRGAKVTRRTPAGITALTLAEASRQPELLSAIVAAAVRQDPGWAAATMTNAAEAGNVRVIDQLLLSGASANGGGAGAQRVPLHAAAFRAHGAVVERLLRAGADARAKDASGNTATLAAVMGGMASRDLITVLFDAARREDPPNLDGFTALDVASTRMPPDPELVALLSVGNSGRPLVEQITLAVLSGNGPEIRRLAMQDRGLLATEAGAGRGLVALAAAQSSMDALAALLGAGASPNGLAGEAQTPLLVAVAARNTDAVRRLIEAGADPFAKGDGRQTPRELARQRNDAAIQQALQQAETVRARAVSTALFSLGYLPQPSDQWTRAIDDQIGQFRRHRSLDSAQDSLLQLAAAVRSTIRFCNRSAREVSVATAAPLQEDAARFRVYSWLNIGPGRCDRMTERVRPGSTAYYVVVRADRPVPPQGPSAGFCLNLRDGQVGVQTPGMACAASSTIVPFQAYTLQEGRDPLIVLQ